MSMFERSLAVLWPLLLVAEDRAFEKHVIERDLASGYAVLVADLSGDGRPDVVGLSQRTDELFWYENPNWQRRPIVAGMRRMITLDAADIDGDRVPEIALGTRFDQTDATSEGRVYILSSRGDTSQPWEAHEIDRLPTTHRLRFLDFDRDGVPELINSPLTGPGCRGPGFDCSTPIVYYEPSDWKRRYLTRHLSGVVHGMREVDWDGPAVLVASMGGIDRFRPSRSGSWVRLRLASGVIADGPAGGASEIRMGRSVQGRLLATIEPWHGNRVVVYCCEGGGYLSRTVLDDTFVDGHVLEVADFDGDGSDEIVAGMRGRPQRLFVYRLDASGWVRDIVDDGGISAAGCDLGDIDGDGDTDIVCIGSRTRNILWYENRVVRRPQ